MARGRPKGTWTPLRKRMDEERSTDPQATLAELARRCGLYSYRDARRVIKDIQMMQQA